MTVLVVDGLTVEYQGPGGGVRALDGFDMRVDSGSLVLVMGPSGSGKTTLLSCLAAILTPNAGTIFNGDIEVTALDRRAVLDYRRKHVGIAFQAFNLVPSFTALENVMAPLVAAGSSRSVARRRATRLLGLVDVADRARHHPSDLSGGQQQRVAIARALAHDPPLLLADEPTAHLDRHNVTGVATLLRGLAIPGRTVVAATHDERLRAVADTIVHVPNDEPTALLSVPTPRETQG